MPGYLIINPEDFQFRDAAGNNTALDSFDLIKHLASKLKNNPDINVTIADYQNHPVILNLHTGLSAAVSIGDVQNDFTGLPTFREIKKALAYYSLVKLQDHVNNMDNPPSDIKRQINSQLNSLTSSVTLFSAAPEAITIGKVEYQVTCLSDKEKVVRELQQAITYESTPQAGIRS